ncbi:MAG: TylF/MycF/NovP-related O-methyltransferase [Planctomycetota bacterium]
MSQNQTVQTQPRLAPIEPDGYGTHRRHADYVARFDEARLAAGQEYLAVEQERARFFHMLEMLRLSRGVPGATAEAGCYRGLTSFLICRERQLEDDRFSGAGHWMIDSFEGLSEPVAADGPISRDRFDTRHFANTSVEHVRNTLAAFPDVTMVRGWIPDAFADVPEQRYRFVHVDVDLHDPTLHSLEYFYPRLSPGGLLVVDDYGPWVPGLWEGCRPAVESFCKKHDIPFARFDTGNVVLRAV